jgi:putative ABC transport system ATP-binding protein
MIEVQKLRKVYGSGAVAYTALHDVDFTVQPGEVVMLVGPSGSGKTTLLSILGCVLSPTAGSVKLAGQEMAGLAQSQLPEMRLRYIGFVFQAHNLVPALSALDNVALPLQLRGFARSDARREGVSLLEHVGLGKKVNALPRDLSGGQKQRVAIARALAGRPPIILADEPTAALDAETGRGVMETFTALAHDGGHTVVVVTHDNRIFNYADRIVRIEDGRVFEDPNHRRNDGHVA